MNLDKNYSPSIIEDKWRQVWEKNSNLPVGNKSPYTILLPPPNVTGTLHMGHGFQYTLMDALIRYNKMKGFKTLWQPGLDHAGIATQMVVERNIANEGLTKENLGREKFISKVQDWTKITKEKIINQIKYLGSSLAWSKSRFTLDKESSESVSEAFVKLYKDGLIYRGNKLANWDPKLQTAVSDLEVINKEVLGKLYYLSYQIKDSEDAITIATTRPETIFADTAIAYHPDDKKHQYLATKKAIVPVSGHEIRFVACDSVDKDFGTGLVKITPAHDFNDFKTGIKHDLKVINILTKTAQLNENVPKDYQGLSVEKARSKIIIDLKSTNALIKTKDHKIMLPIGDRSGATIEPLLTYQWFLKTKPLAEPALKTVKDKKIIFTPQNWENTYFRWLENIEDWCISRQLWWGHQIPAWYDQDNNVYVGKSLENVKKENNLGDEVILTQDNDVLDTWFSSALWPLSTTGWPDKTDEHYPSDVLVTGFDIIFFWVARMIMFGLYFKKEIPFKRVYVTGLIKDGYGEKMSKSKGNIIDPIDLIDGISIKELLDKRTKNVMQQSTLDKIIEKTKEEFADGIQAYGTDAVRFNFCALAHQSRDIKFDLKRLKGFSNFCNKVYQASRFVIENCPGQNYDANLKPVTKFDYWMYDRLSVASLEIEKHFNDMRFDLISEKLYSLIWDDFCAKYLEICKYQLTKYNESTESFLINVLERILAMLHPLMPFITAEIWSLIKDKLKRPELELTDRMYPKLKALNANNKEANTALDVIDTINQFRGKFQLPRKQTITFYTNEEIAEKETINNITNSIFIIKKSELPNIKVDKYVFAYDLVKKDNLSPAEKGKKILKLSNKIVSYENKFKNAKFMSNAPKEIIEKEQKELLLLKEELNTLQAPE